MLTLSVIVKNRLYKLVKVSLRVILKILTNSKTEVSHKNLLNKRGVEV